MDSMGIDSKKPASTAGSPPAAEESPRRDGLARWLPWLFCLVSVWPYAGLVTSGEAVLRDFSYADYESYQLPVREFVCDELTAGRFPHWIPWLGCGIPIHSTSQLGLLYPLHAPWLIWPDTNAGLKLSLFLHVGICFWGAYLLGRELQLSIPAAAMAGLVMSQSQFLTEHLAVGHLCLVFAYALIPWLLLTLRRCAMVPAPRRAGQLALATGSLLLVGQPQIPYYTLLFGAGWLLHMLLAETPGGMRWRSIGWTGCGLLLGVGLAGVQWLPTFVLLQTKELQLERGSVDYAGNYAMEPRDLVRFGFPLMWGDQTFHIPEFSPPDFPHEKGAYWGWLTMLLAFSAMLRTSLKHWSAAFLLLLALQIVIALGNSTPLFAGLCRIVPGLTLFRCPARCLAVGSCLLPLLAGRGLDLLTDFTSQRPQCPVWPRAVILIGGYNLLFLVFVDLQKVDWERWSRFAVEWLSWYLWLTASLAFLSVLFFCLLSRLRREVAALVIGGVLSLELNLLSVQSLKLEPPRTTNLAGLLQLQSNERFGPAAVNRSSLQYSRHVPQAIRARARFVGTNEGGVLPDAVDQLLQAAEHNREVLLTLAAVRWTLHPQREPELSPRQALPRCWIAPADLAPLLERPLSELSSTELISLIRHADAQGAELLLDEPQRQTVYCRLPAPGWLVLADNITSDWHCEVDGQPRPIQAAFGSFRAVQLPAGEHQVRFVFRSSSFQTGLWLSCAALLACLLLIGADFAGVRWLSRC